MVTVLVNTICNGILVSCVSVRGINVLIKLKKNNNNNKKKNLLLKVIFS